MSTKNTLRLIILMLLVNSQMAVVAGAAQQKDRRPNVYERAFQECVQARTGFGFDAKLTDPKRIKALLEKEIRLELKSEALARAAARGDVALLQLLITHEADVNYVDAQGQTVLMLATVHGFHAQCGNDSRLYSYGGNAWQVRKLLAAGPRLNDRDREGNTALMLAAKYGRSDIVKILLDAGADVHLKNTHGETALIHAVSSIGTFDEAQLKITVKALIAGGSNLNERDEQCMTALAYAARSPAIAAQLIFAGAME